MWPGFCLRGLLRPVSSGVIKWRYGRESATPRNSKMKKLAVLSALLLLVVSGASGDDSNRPAVTHYSLQLQLFPKEHRLEAEATLSVKNTTGKKEAEIPFLLYRLLQVQAVADEHGPLKFSEQVVTDADTSNLQVNYVRVHLR